MRRTYLVENDRQQLFDVICGVVQDQNYDVLYADRYHLEVEAMQSKRLGKKKHLSVLISILKRNEVEISIEVRNVGLEIKRNKLNDLLEAQIERAMVSKIRSKKKRYSAA